MSTHVNDAPVNRDDRKRKRKAGAFLKFGLAGAALLGIGLAATSAAWTNDAWFNASASSATVKLDASLDNSTWVLADDGATGVAVDLTNLNQGASVSKALYLKNNGTVTVTVNAVAVVTKSGTLFSGSGTGNLANPTVTVADLPVTTLAPGAGTTTTLTVTTPAAWDSSFMSKTGTVIIRYTAQS